MMKVTLVRSVAGSIEKAPGLCAWTGSAQDAPVGGVGRYPSYPGYGQQSVLYGQGRGGLTCVSTPSSPLRAAQKTPSVSVEASAVVPVKPAVVATRARNPAPADFIRSDSKAARCRCSAVCRKLDSPRARRSFSAEVRLGELAAVESTPIDRPESAAGCGCAAARRHAAKVILSGQLDRSGDLRGLGVTKGARAAIEAAGGSRVRGINGKSGKNGGHGRGR